MKFKKLSEKQIIISIDRLTRFKPTEEKYLRVFKDIIVSNLIEPKIKKAELDCMSYDSLRDIAVEIFNSSFEKQSDDYSINQFLKEYENKLFNNNDDINKLLDNKLNYKSAIKLLSSPEALNLQWLMSLKNNDFGKKQRKEKGFLFPIEGVVIVEGITEEILLPQFAKVLGFDLFKNGIKILPAGGKNQVVKLYYSLSEELKFPIFVLLDKDAVDNVNAINKKLRKSDIVYLLNSGEFEDLLTKPLILKTINSDLKNFATISIEDISKDEPMVKVLEEIFKEKGLHEFKKAEFAHLVKQQISSENDISEEIKLIINDIKKLFHTKRWDVCCKILIKCSNNV